MSAVSSKRVSCCVFGSSWREIFPAAPTRNTSLGFPGKQLSSLRRGIENGRHTSRADTNCKGRSALFMSGMLDSRS